LFPFFCLVPSTIVDIKFICFALLNLLPIYLYPSLSEVLFLIPALRHPGL